MTQPLVLAVASDASHNIIKPIQESIKLISGLGVEGDAHAGKTIQHRYDKRRNPDAPNLRQVHLMHSELFEQLEAKGLSVEPGQMGENITTRDLDILTLPLGTQLKIGEAVIELTGLRNPCGYLNQITPGLMKACISKYPDGTLFPQSGVMGIVLASGRICAGDFIHVLLPETPYQRLKPV